MGRDLFIGLGGTGGNTLRILHSKLTPEQQKNADYVYIDTDRKDINALKQQGISTIRISTANTVREIADGLGRSDGVMDWLPYNDNEGVFLDSNVDDGASQYRYKSRLCLARFLRNPNNAIRQTLAKLSPPGAELQNERMRVIIVSSIAGGTGAGTFIEMALYVRKFFRDFNQSSVSIIGLLACPDLFTKLPADETGLNESQMTAMYANAYAAIRELNAMNLATSTGATTNDYGSKIHLKVSTASEGKLFDSNDPEFKLYTKAKPFDVIYFIDEANNAGGILSGVEQYYAMMADIAYSRLYSPLEASIGSEESNELDAHISAPTAIYGSAGLARIRYPYEDILKYLAERKMYDEIDSRWRTFDDQWSAECESERDLAAQEGRYWLPSDRLRGRRFVEALDADLSDREHASFRFLEDMIREEGGFSRIETFMQQIDSAIQAGDPFGGSSDSGVFSLCKDTSVQEALERFINTCGGAGASAGDDPIGKLEIMAKNANSYWPDLCAALRKSISGQANRLISAIIPTTTTMLENANASRRPINLHWGLLCKGKDNVHPLAARYLLYSLRDRLMTEIDGSKDASDFQSALVEQGKAIRLAFDEEWDDNEDYTVEDEIKALSKIWRAGKRESSALISLNKYSEIVKGCVDGALNIATDEYKRTAFAMLMNGLNELIAQYEAFFENLDHYQQELQRVVRRDHVMHDSKRNQVIYVGASSKVKDYYYLAQPSITSALENSAAECYAAEGAGVYEVLEKRMMKAIEANKIRRRMGQDDSSSERFEDMGQIFETIISKLRDYLRNNALYLKTDAVGALTNEICSELGIDTDTLASKDRSMQSPAQVMNRNRFQDAFYERIVDLQAKAVPMIRYNKQNSRKYYIEEEKRHDLDVSLLHRYFGISPKQLASLSKFFASVDDFKTAMGINNLVSNENFSDNEIFCFTAVHCLQPNQIYHFDELQAESYFTAYKKRVHAAIETGRLSKSPHLDKRWHLKGAMPYISKELELQWRDRIMRAFLFQILTRQITFTIDRDGKECFLACAKGETKFIEWPEHTPVLTRNISRLVEYLAEDELLVEESANSLNELIKACIVRNTGYGDSTGLYKTSMTKDLLLKRLRTNSIIFYKTSRTEAKMSDDEKRAVMEIRRKMRITRGEDPSEALDEDDIVNLKASMGGILRIAFLLHMSEERFDEDRDFGEALLRTVQEIIDEYATGMYGVGKVDGTSRFHREYVEIYNWALDRFLDSWIEQYSREHRLAEKLERVEEEEDDLMKLVHGTQSSVKNISQDVQTSEEYQWIRANWTYKKY